MQICPDGDTISVMNHKKEKVIRLYHYTKAETLQKILKSKRLLLTAASDSNDPFECSFNAGNAFGGEREFLDHAITEMKDDPPLFISFSQVMSSPSMWSHYADSHRGVCLVFDIPVKMYTKKTSPSPELIATARAIYPIEYTSKQPNWDDIQLADSRKRCQRLLRDAITRKGGEWEFEHEVRLLAAMAVPTPEIHMDITWENGVPFLMGMIGFLKGVILGARCDLRISSVEALIREYLDGARMPVARAKCSHTDYRIEAEGFIDSVEDTKEIQRFFENAANGEEIDRVWYMQPNLSDAPAE